MFINYWITFQPFATSACLTVIIIVVRIWMSFLSSFLECNALIKCFWSVFGAYLTWYKAKMILHFRGLINHISNCLCLQKYWLWSLCSRWTFLTRNMNIAHTFSECIKEIVNDSAVHCRGQSHFESHNCVPGLSTNIKVQVTQNPAMPDQFLSPTHHNGVLKKLKKMYLKKDIHLNLRPWKSHDNLKFAIQQSYLIAKVTQDEQLLSYYNVNISLGLETHKHNICGITFCTSTAHSAHIYLVAT